MASAEITCSKCGERKRVALRNARSEGTAAEGPTQFPAPAVDSWLIPTVCDDCTEDKTESAAEEDPAPVEEEKKPARKTRGSR
jgi:hypothetical protein